MSNIAENSVFEPYIRLVEASDYVTGGVGGLANEAPRQLANRTRFLYEWLTRFTGMIVPFPMNEPPPGWLECNGALLSRETYGALWVFAQGSGNIITDAQWTTETENGMFSSGDGSTTFRLPDLRGEFIRVWDNGRGINSGRELGSWQADDIKSHNHGWRAATSAQAVLGSFPQVTGSYLDNTFYATTFTGGGETRPRSIAYIYCIKY